MPKSKTQHDPLPDTFDSLEELIKFWDTHDTEDYPDAWREVKFNVLPQARRHPRIILEPTLAQQLERRARSLNISLNVLVNQILKESVTPKPR